MEMEKLSKKLPVILPVAFMLFLTSCSRHDELIAFYTFFFIVIFIFFCVPGVVLSAVSRSAKTNTAKTVGIIFTSIGAFFALIYTMSLFNNLSPSRDEQLWFFLIFMWGGLATALILLTAPKSPDAQAQQNTPPPTPRPSNEGAVFQTEEEILAAAERIKQKKEQQQSDAQSSEYLNPKPDEKADDVDMSGLDDLSDL